MSHQIKVLLVDEDNTFRQFARAGLQNTHDIIVVGEGLAGQDAVILASELRPDVILLGVDGLCVEHIDTMAQINRVAPQSKLIVLGRESVDKSLVLEAFRKGAWGYLHKKVAHAKAKPDEEPLAEIIKAIRTVSQGGAAISPDVAGWILDAVYEISQR